ncbi:MAG: hypothetical protein ACI91G_001017, partial [Gammaproteobacteria bacterium]
MPLHNELTSALRKPVMDWLYIATPTLLLQLLLALSV